jgi:hypothetical protein
MGKLYADYFEGGGGNRLGVRKKVWISPELAEAILMTKEDRVEASTSKEQILERPTGPPAEVKAVEVRSGRGRPKKEGKRPWEEAGMSKSTWYEKKSKGEV